MGELIDRFPDLALQLKLHSFHPFELFTNAEGKINAKRERQYLYAREGIDSEVCAWIGKTDLRDVEIVYIYGLGLGYYYEPLKAWLKEKKERALVFIEDDLAVIDACFRAKAVDFLENFQVHVRFLPQTKRYGNFLESLAHFFPSDRICFTALESYARLHSKKIASMRLHLQRSSAVFEALLSEALNSHRLFANLYPNFKHLPHSFFANSWKDRFKNLPAIICGAGPSLTAASSLLKEVKERALIVAGGSALTALSSEGIHPHIALALDPNPVEFERLKMSTAFEMPFLYAPRLFPKVFALLNGPLGYMCTDTGGAVEARLEKELHEEATPLGPELGKEALSVTTIATALCRHLGCNPVLFVGVDLAFTDNNIYASGVVSDARAAIEKLKQETKSLDQLLRRKGHQGKFVYTLVKWVMESTTLSAYAAAHPEMHTINCTEGGLGFEKIPYMSLKTALNQYCKRQYDLSGWVHAEVQQTRFPEGSKTQIEFFFQELQASLRRSALLIEEMLSDKTLGKRAVLEMDLREELAFDCCFAAAGAALERISARFHEVDFFEETCKQYRAMIDAYLKIF